LIPDQRIDEIRFNQQNEFTAWSEKLFEAFSAHSEKSRAIIAHNKLLGFHNFDFNLLHSPFKLTFTDATLNMEPCSYYRSDAVLVTVVSNEVVNLDPINHIHSLEAKFEAGSLAFQPGDSIGVIPSNPSEIVNKLISRIGYKPTQVFQIEAGDMNFVELACSLGQNKCTLEIALTYFFDITSPPSTALLKFFGMHVGKGDQKVLASYAENYPSFLRLEHSILDVLETMPSIKLISGDEQKKVETLSIFLGLLGPIKQRHYSVSNYAEASPNTLRILYKVVEYATKDGRTKKGLCTNYLKVKRTGDTVSMFLARTKFRLPEDSRAPVILLSTGSGIAPYLGFLEQRLYQQEKGERVGQGILIHGCRTENDFAHRPAVDKALAGGVLDVVHAAYSRKPDSPTMHVQDVVEHHGSKVWDMLSKEGATIYVCGDVSISTSVRAALVRVAKEHGKLSIFLANAWVRKLAENRMFRTDEWGIATIDGTQSVRAARLRLWRRSILAVFAFHTHNNKL